LISTEIPLAIHC